MIFDSGIPLSVEDVLILSFDGFHDLGLFIRFLPCSSLIPITLACVAQPASFQFEHDLG